ncbi:MAG: ABC transporter permease [Candidatus Woesebacteria bacterium]|nr:ABC transporter permease [Candidatus Woesebacteria bacterium]
MKSNNKNIVIIKPKSNPFNINWREIWDSKDLFYFLTWRDIKVRYKQTILGVAWMILQPLISMVVFTIIFGNFASIPSDNIPYPIFVFIGLLFWQFFSATLNSTANSLISNEGIIKKIYFPRIMAPISSTFAHIVDLIPTIIILAGLLFYYKVTPTLQSIILMPLLLLLILITSLGVGMFLAPINAKFRDIRYILPFFIQLGMYATPVIWPTSMFGGNSVLVRILNPVAEVIEVSRSAFFNTRPMDWRIFILSYLFAIGLFLIGLYYFRTKEDSFVDIL